MNHRVQQSPPVLFVHGVSELVPGKSARGFVTVPADHPYTFCQPHVPAGLLIEAMAQLGGIAVLYEPRVEKPVDSGARLDLFAEVGRRRGPFAEARAEAGTSGEAIASATLAFALP